MQSRMSGGVREFSVGAPRGGKYLKPFLLADIGEGITECEIVKWSVPLSSFPLLLCDFSREAVAELRRKCGEAVWEDCRLMSVCAVQDG